MDQSEKEARAAERERNKREKAELRSIIYQKVLDMVLVGDRRGYVVAYVASVVPLEDLRALAKMDKKELVEFSEKIFRYMGQRKHLYPPPDGWVFLKEPMNQLQPALDEEPSEAYLILARFSVLVPLYRALIAFEAWRRFKDSPEGLSAALRILSRSDEYDRMIVERSPELIRSNRPEGAKNGKEP